MIRAKDSSNHRSQAEARVVAVLVAAFFKSFEVGGLGSAIRGCVG